MIKNAKFSGYYFDMNLIIWRDFQICISVPKRHLIKELRFIDIVNSIISLKWLCQTLTPEYFQHLCYS